jgi:hypothetical protein
VMPSGMLRHPLFARWSTTGPPTRRPRAATPRPWLHEDPRTGRSGLAIAFSWSSLATFVMRSIDWRARIFVPSMSFPWSFASITLKATDGTVRESTLPLHVPTTATLLLCLLRCNWCHILPLLTRLPA